MKYGQVLEAKVKAKQLIDQYEHSTYSQVQGELAKQCALVTVDEMLTFVSDNIQIFIDADTSFITYWKEVKQEIEKL